MHYTGFFSCSFATWELALSAERHAKGDQGKQLNINQCQIMHSVHRSEIPCMREVYNSSEDPPCKLLPCHLHNPPHKFQLCIYR